MYEALADIGLTPPQYAALKILEAAPGISSAEIARQAFVSAQTMQAIVAGLERRELLVRRARPTGRVLAAWPTRRGLAALAAARDRAARVEDRTTLALTDEEHRVLIELLRRCADSLERPGSVAAAPVSGRKDDR